MGDDDAHRRVRVRLQQLGPVATEEVEDPPDADSDGDEPDESGDVPDDAS
jgi:hypothetical protein